MTDFELREQRGWGVYGQNPRTGEWILDGATRSEMMAYTYAGESQRVEEVTIRPVCLGADPVQWAAVQMALALFNALHTEGYLVEQPRFRNFRNTMHALFGGSLEREP